MLGINRRAGARDSGIMRCEQRVSSACSPDENTAHGLVLMIDDDDCVRRAARHILELFGYRVVEANGGRAAIETLSARRAEIRLVLLDMTMPDMSGPETFQALRRIADDVPVILASGCSEAEAARAFAHEGLFGFLHKPFMPEEMAQMVCAAFREYDAPTGERRRLFRDTSSSR